MPSPSLVLLRWQACQLYQKLQERPLWDALWIVFLLVITPVAEVAWGVVGNVVETAEATVTRDAATLVKVAVMAAAE